VRGASAISLLMAICFSLIAPAVFANPESNLPACCRRNGAHQCAIAMDGSATTTQPSFQPIRQRCPSFPIATAEPGGGAAFLRNSTTNFPLTVSHRSNRFQTEAFYRISFSRSRQKRGPPTVLS
jgi:hypothetical protein